jgi:glycosyltransferase involved in cell wall biosynthesis
MRRIGVVQIVDTLSTGGSERVAVNLANLLPEDVYDVTLCTTRRGGPLSEFVAPHVRRLDLSRRHTFDLSALRRLVQYNQRHRVSILHAHATSVFLAATAAAFPPRPAVIWHDHFGSSAIRTRPAWVYRLIASRLNAVVAVNDQLRDWSIHALRVPAGRVSYVPNFVSDAAVVPAPSAPLPGTPGQRVVCVANFRPQKDHLTLVEAMAGVIRSEPGAHLLLIGACGDASYLEAVRASIQAAGLERHITILGERLDAPSIIRACDVAVLSSRSEGLPLVALEYGAAGLPVVATAVGQVPEVLNGGDAGVLVPPGSPGDLCDGILGLLRSADRRQRYAAALQQRVASAYSAKAAVRRLCSIYDAILPSFARVA